MSEIGEIFFEMFYGSGAWLMLILIVTILVSGGWANKYLAMIFSLVSILLGIEYLTNVSVNSNFMWAAGIMFLTSIFLVIRMTKKG